MTGVLRSSRPRGAQAVTRTPAFMEVVGERRKHLGPIMQFARVGLRAEPAEAFEVVDHLDGDLGARSFGFPGAFIRGVLEELQAGSPHPPLRLILTFADHDPIDSSPQAFVEAGRDAGRKLRALQDRD